MKKICRIFALVLIFCLVTTGVMAADVEFVPSVEGNGTVTVDIKLDSIPTNLDDVSAITIRYKYDESKLTYVSTVGNGTVFEKITGNGGNIIWYDETFDSSKAVTEQRLKELGNLICTLTFQKSEDAYGETDIEITFVQLGSSKLVEGEGVSFSTTTINLGEAPDDNAGGDNTGGDNTGGDNTGGDNTGGDNTGGDNTGGDNAGGDNAGGDSTGGDNTGGDSTGGDNTGGDNAGGDNTGGDNTGGDNAGGGNTGGDNTGGGNTGGDNTGGDNAGGDNAGGNNTGGGNTGGNNTGGNNTGGNNSDKKDDDNSKGNGSKVNIGGGGGIGVSTPKPPVFSGFADIPNDNWGYAHTYSLMQKGIISGDGAAKPSMRPNDYLTRAEAAKIALLAMGAKAEEGLALDFSDADSVPVWAAPYIATAVKHGLLTGYSDGRVAANDNITREQMLTILARAMKWEIKDGELNFTDNADISEWSKPAIAYAVQLGVMNGYNDGSVRPKANITRIEVFALVDRCLK